MSDTFVWLAEGGIARFVWDAAWQSTLVCSVAWISLKWIRQPALRSAVSLLTVLLCVALPITTLCGRALDVGLWRAAKATSRASFSVTENLTPGTRRSEDFTEPAPQPTPSAAASPTSPADWAVFVWLVVTGLLFLRVLASAISVTRLVRRSATCEDLTVLAAVRRASERMKVVEPRVLTTSEVRSPTVVAFFRPTLLLPAEWIAADATSASQHAARLDAVCAHEMAHIRRRDGWARLFVELCVAALPWQPGMWWLRRAFASAAEDACDDWAVAAGCEPAAVAAVLTEFVPLISHQGLGVAMSTTDVRQRVLRLLSLSGEIHPAASRRSHYLLLATAIVLAVAAAVTQPATAVEEPSDPLPATANRSTDGPESAGGNEELPPTATPEYVVEPPDVLMIDAVKLVPKAPYHLETLDVLRIQGAGLLPDAPLAGEFSIEPGGRVSLGPSYGTVKLNGMTLEDAQQAIVKHLQESLGIRSPEISVQLASTSGMQVINGEHLVGPDGRVNLGSYGSVYVAGMTLPEVRSAVESHLKKYMEEPTVSVDVFKFNSKVYYIVINDEENGGQVIRRPLTGSETVLDAIAVATESAQVRLGANSKIWLARQNAYKDEDKLEVLEVDLKSIVHGGAAGTNYRLKTRDRVFISQPMTSQKEDSPSRRAGGR